MRLAILLSQVRLEEKLIFAAAEAAGFDLVKVFDKELVLDLEEPCFPEADLVLDRGLVHSRAEYTLRFLRDLGVPTVNSYEATITCDNKFLTSSTLVQAGVPTLRTLIAYTPRSALEAIERVGYPAVLKPTAGSWGRLLAKINDRDAAEAVLEHKEVLGSYHHSIFYVQEYIPKRGGDIRAFVVGGRVIGASYRSSEHWITNVARGAATAPAPVTSEIEEIAPEGGGCRGRGNPGCGSGGDRCMAEGDRDQHRCGVQGAGGGDGVDVPAEIVQYLKARQ